MPLVDPVYNKLWPRCQAQSPHLDPTRRRSTVQVQALRSHRSLHVHSSNSQAEQPARFAQTLTISLLLNASELYTSLQVCRNQSTQSTIRPGCCEPHQHVRPCESIHQGRQLHVSHVSYLAQIRSCCTYRFRLAAKLLQLPRDTMPLAAAARRVWVKARQRVPIMRSVCAGQISLEDLICDM